jgi:hypothetical protein
MSHLYNERPAWLISAHKDLDNAVAAAYGWPSDLSDDQILANLLDLNLARTAEKLGRQLVRLPPKTELSEHNTCHHNNVVQLSAMMADTTLQYSPSE